MAEKKNSAPRGRIDYSKNSARTPAKRKDNNENSRITTAIIRLLAVLVILLLALALWRNRIDLSCANMTQCGRDSFAMCGGGEGFPATINGSRSCAIEPIAGKGVALLSDTSMTIYDETAKEVTVNAHFMSSPAMKTAGRYAMVFDIGSTDFRVESASGTIATGDAERPLISCAISRNCCYAMVMQGSSKGESWLSSVEVFSRDGKSIHKWHCAEWYLTDAALSADGKYFAMAGVNASEGDLTSAIIIQEVGSKGEVAVYTMNNGICMSIEYNNDGTLFAVGSNSMYIITDNGTTKEEVVFDGQLTAYDICYDSGAAICVSNELGTTLRVYDARGRERFSCKPENDAQSVALSGEACAVLGEGLLSSYRLDGTLISQIEANATTGGLLLVDRTAYTVDGMHVSAVDLH